MRGHAAAAALRPALLPCRLSRPRRLSRLFAASSCLEPPLNAADVWWLPLTYDMASAVAGREREREQQHPQQVHRCVSNAFLRHVLSQYTNQAPEALRLVRTEHGKPFLPGGLVNFNMSHADGLVGVAVSRCDVGIDLELRERRVRRPGNELKIARRYFSEAEVAAIERETDEEARRNLFVRMWTLKEAYVKAIGRGIGAPPGLSSFGFDLVHGDDGDQSIVFRPGDNEPGRHSAWSFRLLAPADGTLAALCLKRDSTDQGHAPTIVATQHHATLADFDLSSILKAVSI